MDNPNLKSKICCEAGHATKEGVKQQVYSPLLTENHKFTPSQSYKALDIKDLGDQASWMIHLETKKRYDDK